MINRVIGVSVYCTLYNHCIILSCCIFLSGKLFGFDFFEGFLFYYVVLFVLWKTYFTCLFVEGCIPCNRNFCESKVTLSQIDAVVIMEVKETTTCDWLPIDQAAFIVWVWWGSQNVIMVRLKYVLCVVCSKCVYLIFKWSCLYDFWLVFEFIVLVYLWFIRLVVYLMLQG